ncbi:MAG: hypothetical protein AAFW82_08250 [Pseudomonadota bacterium]
MHEGLAIQGGPPRQTGPVVDKVFDLDKPEHRNEQLVQLSRALCNDPGGGGKFVLARLPALC